MAQPTLDPFKVLTSCFAISAMGGFFALLRSNRPITLRTVVAATCYSGLAGLVLGLLWYNYFEGSGNLYFLIGLSGLLGLGGTTLIDFLLNMLNQGGVNVNITAGNRKRNEESELGQSVIDVRPDLSPTDSNPGRSSSINRRRPPIDL